MTRWDVCVHEAGHAVAGFSFGVPVLRAIVYRTFKAKRNLGEVLAYPYYDIPELEHITWFMGGHVAERVVNGTPFPEWIDDSPDYICASEMYPERYSDGLKFAEEFFEAESDTVLRVAWLLRDHKGWCSAARIKAAIEQ